MSEDGIAVAQVFWVERLYAKALEKHTVDAILLHPLEMPEDRIAVVGAKDVSRLPFLMAEGRAISFIGIEFVDIRPEVDAAKTGPELAPDCIVPPPPAGAVFWRREPALVAAHNLASQRGAVNAGCRWAVVGPHGCYHFLTAWRWR
jgi:hypothetical protein